MTVISNKDCGKKSTYLDLTGRKFAYLTVLERDLSKKNGTYWICMCDCGNIKSVRSDHLRKNLVKSCGCHNSKISSKNNSTHHDSKTRLYNIWCSMKGRCNNSNNDAYSNYGGRGIKVCDEWNDSFESFKEWANSSGYTDKLTIDRIDNDGNYCPENCKWSTYSEQANNRRSSNIIYIGLSKGTLSQWLKIYSMSHGVFYSRINAGWTVESAITTPVGRGAN